MSDILDLSRYHNALTPNDVVYKPLPRGLWCPESNGSSGYFTIADIPPLLGAIKATWMAWVYKDWYVQYQCIASDYVDAAAERKWIFGYESADSTWGALVGNGTTTASISVASVFTVGWHFVWVRFTGGSVTGLEAGCDDTVAVPVSVAAVASLGAVGQAHTYVGRQVAVYSSIVLATLRIHNVALTDGEIYQYRESTRRLIGV
jgi:hypothetical protein